VIVVDASAIVDSLVDQPPAAGLLAVLADTPLHAPTLVDFEVASALRGHALGRRLDQSRLDEAVADFRSLRVERHPMSDLLDHLLQLRHRFTVYDAAYVVLARALEAPLVTCDAKLRAASEVGVHVRLFRGG